MSKAVVIKVQYDAYNRTFRLVDQEFRTILEGDVLYDLAIPIVFEDPNIEDVMSVSSAIAHA